MLDATFFWEILDVVFFIQTVGGDKLGKFQTYLNFMMEAS